MKIDKVLFTCNENKEYIGFWNSISRYFKNTIGIEPVLYFLGNADNIEISSEYGEIRQVDPIEGVPTRIQALWGKFYFTKDEPDTTWLIGDLDLYHFDKTYFDIEGDYDYCHLNEDGYHTGKNWRNSDLVDLPGYYHIAKGSTFKDIFNLDESFKDQVVFIRDCKKYGVGFNGRGSIHTGVDGQYQCCEENLSTEILRDKVKDLNFYGRTLPNGSRIDRGQIMLPLNELKDGIRKGDLVDMHCPRPYELYSKRIEELLER